MYMWRWLFLGILVIAILAGGWWFMRPHTPAAAGPSKQPAGELRTTPRQQMSREQAAQVKEVVPAPEVAKVIMKEMRLLGSAATDTVIVQEVRASNESNKNLSSKDITLSTSGAS